MTATRPAAVGRAVPWWHTYPQRWEQELAALTAAGLAWHEDRVERDTWELMAGTVTVPAGSPLTAGSPLAGVAVQLRVVFPATYPWFPPVVSDPHGQLHCVGRHRTGGSGELCLIHDRDWRVDATLAALLAGQLPRALQTAAVDAVTAAGRERLAGLEVPLAAAVATTMRGVYGAMILVDSAWDIPAGVDFGALSLSLDGGPDDAPYLLGEVRCVYGSAGPPVATMGPLLSGRQWPLYGRWLRLPAPPDTDDPELLWAQLAHRLPTVDVTLPNTYPNPNPNPGAGAGQAAPVANGPEPGGAAGGEQGSRRGAQRALLLARYYASRGLVDVIGLLYPEEATWRSGRQRWSWIFLLRWRADRRRHWHTGLIHAGYAGPGDLALRRPHNAALAGKHVLLVGLGAIGGQIAVSLARAGLGAATLLDDQLLEPGNITRHVAGIAVVGTAKAAALHGYMRQHHPSMRIDAAATRIGSAQLDEPEDQHQMIQTRVAQADMVIDCTANPAVHTYLAATAHARRTPYVNVAATAGGWGGAIVRILPGRTAGCWACLGHHRAEHTVPTPPADPHAAPLQPAGCAEATFTGAAEDLDTIAAAAVRVIVHTLTTGHSDPPAGPPADPAIGADACTLDADLHIAALRGPEGAPQPAHWRTARLHRHPACPLHEAVGSPPAGRT